MGRGKHCTEEKRMIIKALLNQGKTYAFIQKTLGCSAKMISNAKKWKESPETRGRKKKTSIADDRNIVISAKKDPFISSAQIKRNLNLEVDTSTIRRRLIKANLPARRPRNVPLLNKKQIKKRLNFAKDHQSWEISKWRNILWSDETKVVRFDSGAGAKHVRRPKKKPFHPKYTKKTIKHGGFSVMVWGCFSWYGVGPIVWIKGTMNADYYVKILNKVMLPYAEDHMPLRWTFMQDNDPKHTSKKARTWFQKNNINVMSWPAQSPDLNPIEHLWVEVKKKLQKQIPQTKKAYGKQ